MSNLISPLPRRTMTKFPSKKRGEEACLLIAEIHRLDALIYQKDYRFAKHNFLTKWRKNKN